MVTIYRLAPPESNVVEKVCVVCGFGAECDMESLFRSDFSARAPGVSKMVTVDVKGSAPLWMKIKDLADGVTYNFRIRAKTLTYGPEVEANITTGPGEGKSPFRGLGGGAFRLPDTSSAHCSPSERSARSSRGTLYFPLRLGPDAALDQRRSRPSGHHAIRH